MFWFNPWLGKIVNVPESSVKSSMDMSQNHKSSELTHYPLFIFPYPSCRPAETDSAERPSKKIKLSDLKACTEADIASLQKPFLSTSLVYNFVVLWLLPQSWFERFLVCSKKKVRSLPLSQIHDMIEGTINLQCSKRLVLMTVPFSCQHALRRKFSINGSAEFITDMGGEKLFLVSRSRNQFLAFREMFPSLFIVSMWGNPFQYAACSDLVQLHENLGAFWVNLSTSLSSSIMIYVHPPISIPIIWSDPAFSFQGFRLEVVIGEMELILGFISSYHTHTSMEPTMNWANPPWKSWPWSGTSWPPIRYHPSPPAGHVN